MKAQPMVLVNARSGLPLAARMPWVDGIANFQSNHAHRVSTGYCGADAMPLHAVAHLLRGGVVVVADASRDGGVPDALVTGVGTWGLVFGRAVRQLAECPWRTAEMTNACWVGPQTEAIVGTIRRLASVFGAPERALAVGMYGGPGRAPWRFNQRSWPFGELPLRGPALLGWSMGAAPWDDKPELMAELCRGLDTRPWIEED